MLKPADRETWIHHLSGELLLFGLTGKILYAVPERGWLQPLVEEKVFTEAPFAQQRPEVRSGLKLISDWSNTAAGLTESAILNLRQDYNRLFLDIGPNRVHPYESVFLSREHLLFQEQTLQVRNWYARYGLQSEALYREPDDHLGLELSFLAHLAGLALQALDQDRTDEFKSLLADQRAFLDEHLMLWALECCDRIHQNAQTGFYRGVALLVKGGLLEAAQILDPTGRQSQEQEA